MKANKLTFQAFGRPSDLHVLQIDEFYVDRRGIQIDFSEYERFDSSGHCGRITHFCWKGKCLSASTRLRWRSEPERFVQGISIRHPDLSFCFYIRTQSTEILFHLKGGQLVGDIIDLKKGDRRSDFMKIIRKSDRSAAIGFHRKGAPLDQ